MTFRFLTSILIGLALGGCTSSRQLDCPIRVDLFEQPRLGDTLEGRLPTNCYTLARSAQMWPSVEATVDSIEFEVGFDRESHRVHWVETQSPGFETPEGVRPGVLYQEVAHLAIAEPLREVGWGEYVCFESGWCAYLTTCGLFDIGASFGCVEIDDQTRVQFVFQRE